MANKETKVEEMETKATETKEVETEAVNVKIVKKPASEISDEVLKSFTGENVAEEVKKINFGKNGRAYLEDRMKKLGIDDSIIEAFRATKGIYATKKRKKGAPVVKRTPLERLMDNVVKFCGEDATEEEINNITENLKNSLETIIERKETREAQKGKTKQVEHIKEVMKKFNINVEELK